MAICVGNTYLAVEGSAQTADEAIRLCGERLVKAGCVREGFAQSCIDREKEYPTGICTMTPVALPHSMSDDILKSSLCYLRLTKAVEFRRMDDERNTIKTRHVFNLAIDRGDHLKFLSKIVSLLQSPQLIGDLEVMDIDRAAAYLHDLIERED